MSEIENDTESLENESEEVGRWRRRPGREDLAWLLVVGGAAGAVVTAARRNRGPLDWLVAAGLLGAGLSVLFQGRQAHIVEAEEAILAELEGLDPIARAQVLKTVAQRQFGRKKDE